MEGKNYFCLLMRQTKAFQENSAACFILCLISQGTVTCLFINCKNGQVEKTMAGKVCTYPECGKQEQERGESIGDEGQVD